jgi:hypothetical protein
MKLNEWDSNLEVVATELQTGDLVKYGVIHTDIVLSVEVTDEEYPTVYVTVMRQVDETRAPVIVWWASGHLAMHKIYRPHYQARRVRV